MLQSLGRFVPCGDLLQPVVDRHGDTLGDDQSTEIRVIGIHDQVIGRGTYGAWHAQSQRSMGPRPIIANRTHVSAIWALVPVIGQFSWNEQTGARYPRGRQDKLVGQVALDMHKKFEQRGRGGQ